MEFVVMSALLAMIAVFVAMLLKAEKGRRRAERVAEGGFLLAFSELLARMAMVDGVVSSDEVKTSTGMFSDMGLSRAERAMCFGNFTLALANETAGEPEGLARELCGTCTHAACLLIYGLILRVALADWRISGEEEGLLAKVGGALGLTEDECGTIRAGKAPELDFDALVDAGVPSALARLATQSGVRDSGLGIWDR